VIVALGGLGALLLVAMAVVAARSLKPEQEDQPLASPLGSVTATGPVEVAPSETAPAPTTQLGNTAGAAAVPTPTPEPSPPKTPVAAGPKPTPSPTPPTPQQGGSTPTPKPPSGGSAGCDNCRSLADSGNIAAAVSAANSCTDQTKKNVCISRIRSGGAQAAKAAALNGQCNVAKQIVAAAAQVGASIGSALNNTSCR
jgi:outer membrane biosynthesis protein TonB